MYRNDQDALQHRVDSLSREAETLRRENKAIREQVGRQHNKLLPTSLPPGAIYRMDVRTLPMAERSRLAAHTMRPFPVWAVGLLNIVTLGLFPLIHFGIMHDRLPRASHNDPTAGKAIGFQFIPYFNMYWIFFSSLRLCDRLNLQLQLRNRPERAPRGLVIAACVFTVIPYAFLISLPILWTIAACLLQSTANKVAALDPSDWDATPSEYDKALGPSDAPDTTGDPELPAHSAYRLSPELAAQQERARKYVTWSHILGWGGLVMLFAGSALIGALVAAPAGVLVGVASFISVVVGAIIGQIGRGMQGRAI